ncbi:MAG: substrate-binding domain-containing protein [Paludibacteraceae bacterium]|nr:substrate-binding domain-containing protein [Paludibacteraceae bacterium]
MKKFAVHPLFSFVHKSYIVLLSFVLLSFVLLFTACTPNKPQYRIGVSQCLDDAWREKMNYEMGRELLLHPEMTLTRRIAYGSNELQCAQIDSFIAERVDLLIVSPNEAEEVKPAVTRAYRAGIPVIVADRRVTGDEWTAFIGGDNYRVGALMAQWIESLQSQSSKPLHVLEVAGLPGSTPATLRHKGMMESMAEHGGVQPVVQSVQGAWYKETAYKAVSEFLRTHEDVDVIVAQNDLMAIGASEAVHANKAYASKHVPIMGVDGIQLGLQAIVDGTITCTATYASRGDMVIATAADILHNEPFVRDTVLETTLIDASLAYPMLRQDEAITRDLETLHIIQVQTARQWRQVQIDRIFLISGIVLLFLLFLLAISYIIFAQRRMQNEISKEIIPQLEDVQSAIQLSQRDMLFAERLKQVVDEHLSDPELTVESLANMLLLSRTQVFRRVKSVTGKGPLDYIREQRLIRAEQLLRTTDMTVQQVALELCFSSPGYFSKCYKEYFGHLPSKVSR